MTALFGKRIFYVEDDVKNRGVVKIILEYAGAVVFTESWGDPETTHHRLNACGNIDLILLDLMLPKSVSGYDVFDVLHADPAFKSASIVAISASDPAIEVPKLRARGFDGFIAKPINVYCFPEQIAAILTKSADWYEY